MRVLSGRAGEDTQPNLQRTPLAETISSIPPELRTSFDPGLGPAVPFRGEGRTSPNRMSLDTPGSRPSLHHRPGAQQGGHPEGNTVLLGDLKRVSTASARRMRPLKKRLSRGECWLSAEVQGAQAVA